ncbi:MAG: SRPBCC family protein [Tepidisphaeraceae bacterium]
MRDGGDGQRSVAYTAATMPTLEFETTVRAPLEKVWTFFEDVTTSLPALSPPGDEVKVESADLPVHEGSRIVLTINGPLGRVRWVAKIVEHRPPHAVVFGEEARFVDVQESGPFAAWRHEHDFERIDERTTRVIDRVSYRVPLGPIGWIADRLFIRRKFHSLFRHRHERIKAMLDMET